jgi:branched-chain amino acid transport system substrate-binding protein
MKKWFRVSSILVVAVMLLTLLAACATEQQKPAPPKQTGPIVINIGLPMALSGSASPWGQIPTPLREAWVEVFNKEGFKVGDKLYNIKLIQVDDQNTAEGGAAAAKQLIYGDNCKFFAGHWTWNFSAIASVTNPAKVIFITRTGAPDALPASQKGAYDPKTMPYVVFGCPSNDEYINDGLALVEAYPNYGVLGGLDSSVSKDGPGWAVVDAAYKKAGVKSATEWFTPGTTDFAPIITRFAQQGCKVVFVAGWIGEFMMFLKQRYEMGYKDMKVACSGPFVSLDMYKSVVGADAFEGAIGAYYAPWDLKKVKVTQKYQDMCREAMKIAAQKTGKPYEYTGEIPWVPSHTLILTQAMQKAGTVDDPDAIMKAIRGGTFDTTVGKWTMSGAQTYGSPICFGTAASMCEIKGGKEVYIGEHPMDPIP